MDPNVNFIQVANSIIHLKKLVPHLIKNGVYSEAIIRSKTGAYTAVETQTLNIVLGLKKKGHKALETFYHCLIAAEEYDAAKIMNPSFQIPGQLISNTSEERMIQHIEEHNPGTNTNPTFQIPEPQFNNNNEENIKVSVEIPQSTVQTIKPTEAQEHNPWIYINPTFQLPEQRFNNNNEENIEVSAGNLQSSVQTIKRIEERVDVHVRQAEKLEDNETSRAPIYRMKSNPKGYALVIVNLNFECNNKRVGAEKDYAMLVALFSGLGYLVCAYQDLTKIQMADVGEKFAKLDHSSVDSCVVAVSTHGKDDCLLGTDSRGYPRERLIALLNNRNCPQLMHKPKLFFFQACRGERHDIGADDAVDGGSLSLPSFTDMWIFSSTIPEYVSWRNVKGSWFIVAVTEAFAEHAWNTPLSELYVKVDELMERMEARTMVHEKQVAELSRRSFRKDLYFNPGLYEVQQAMHKV